MKKEDLKEFQTVDIPLELSTKRSYADITIDGKNFRMVEFAGKDRDTYLSFVSKKSSHVGDRSVVRDFTGLSSQLIAMCLWDVETNELVSQSAIDAWPSSTVDALYKLAAKLNGLDNAAVDEAKKK